MFDVVTVFNRLTQTELADSSLFETVLDNHYEKYKYFYYLVAYMNLDSVDKIYCECPGDNKSLIVVAEFKKKADRDDFSSTLKSNIKTTKTQNGKFFRVKLNDDGKALNISIENKSISREDEIYEDRFDPR